MLYAIIYVYGRNELGESRKQIENAQGRNLGRQFLQKRLIDTLTRSTDQKNFILGLWGWFSECSSKKGFANFDGWVNKSRTSELITYLYIDSTEWTLCVDFRGMGGINKFLYHDTKWLIEYSIDCVSIQEGCGIQPHNTTFIQLDKWARGVAVVSCKHGSSTICATISNRSQRHRIRFQLNLRCLTPGKAFYWRRCYAVECLL